MSECAGSSTPSQLCYTPDSAKSPTSQGFAGLVPLAIFPSFVSGRNAVLLTDVCGLCFCRIGQVGSFDYVFPSWVTLPGVATKVPTSTDFSVSYVRLVPPLTVEWDENVYSYVSLCGSVTNPYDVPSQLVSMRVIFIVPLSWWS